ncbi:adenine phosphoribosyltransferase [Qipengyuania sp. GH1]|uniref:adenine phosphoribosyltransferase n=1 Tax=Qipengyuania aestuarii TaxID=2867241 RepID=UPI001C889CF5|nr:adenine phosphoribosyltransferase [Qipengyuania aestuarii]
MTPDQLKSLVRTIPDFPVAGIQFRDITTLIGHGAGFAATVDWLAEKVRHSGAEAIAGMEARGFIFGASVAARLGLPFLPIRKPGKLPCDTIGVDYALEYGADRLEMDPASVSRDQKVAIVDDLLATGGTACATVELLRQAGADVADAFFVIDLPDLGGAKRLHEAGISVAALMQFDGD